MTRRGYSTQNRPVLAARGVYGAGQPASGEAGDQIREAQHRYTVARFLNIGPAPAWQRRRLYDQDPRKLDTVRV